MASSFVEDLEQRVREAVEARLIEECRRTANRVVNEEIERIVGNLALKVFKAEMGEQYQGATPRYLVEVKVNGAAKY